MKFRFAAIQVHPFRLDPCDLALELHAVCEISKHCNSQSVNPAYMLLPDGRDWLLQWI